MNVFADHNKSDKDCDVCKTVSFLLFTASGPCTFSPLNALSTSEEEGLSPLTDFSTKRLSTF